MEVSLRTTPVHEAGHAIAALEEAFDLEGISLKRQESPRETNLVVNATCNVNYGLDVPEKELLSFCRRKMVFASAGAAAEAEVFGRNVEMILQQETDDMALIKEIEGGLRELGISEHDISILRHESLEKAKRIAACKRGAIVAVARLVQRRVTEQQNEISVTEIKDAVQKSQMATEATPPGNKEVP